MVLAVALSACGGSGLSEGFRQTLGVDLGRSRIVSCSDPGNGDVITEVLTVERAQAPVEIVDVELLEGSFDAEFFVVTVPTELTLFWGTSSLEGMQDSDLRDAWNDRQPLPGTIPVGFTGGVVAVLPPSPGSIDYLRRYRVTAAVGGERGDYEWEALRMIGDPDRCAVLGPTSPVLLEHAAGGAF